MENIKYFSVGDQVQKVLNNFGTVYIICDIDVKHNEIWISILGSEERQGPFSPFDIDLDSRQGGA